jgi:uncharacterized protein (DUF849 family)
MRKVIVEARLNERADRSINPNVPWTAGEIAEDGKACVEAGAAIIHYHGRSTDGGCVDDLATHRDIVTALRSACDALIHPSLGDKALHATAAERFDVILALAAEGLAPDLAPVGMAPRLLGETSEAEMLGCDGAEEALRATIRDAVTLLADAGVTSYFDIWNMRAMRRAGAMMKEHLFGDRPLLMLSTAAPNVLDGDGARELQPATRDGLTGFIKHLPADQPHDWTALSYHENLLPLIPRIIERGGHVSIGLGDHPYPELGLPTNAGLVREVVRILRSHGCETATPEEARAMLAMRGQPHPVTMALQGSS